MTAAASLYEGYLDYKGPKDKHFKSYYAQLLPKQLLLRDDISSSSAQPKSVYIQSGKYGEGKSHDKKKIYEFYVDGMTGRHYFKVNMISQRKSWLEYFKIADEQLDIGVYDKVVTHSQAKQPQTGYGNIQLQTGYGNLQGHNAHSPSPAAYSTLPGTAMTSPQHYAGSHASPQHYAYGKNVMKTAVHTMASNRMRDNSPLPVDNVPPPLPPGRDDVPPSLPPGRGDVPPPLPPGRDDPPPLPPGRDDVPPPLPPGRDDPPPLPPGREDVPPPLPPGRDDVPPPLPPGRDEFSSPEEDIPPPLPPGRPEESPLHSAPVSNRIKQQGFGFAVTPNDLQKAHEHIHDSGLHGGQWKGHRLDKRDSGNVSGDGTIFHNAKSHHVIKVTSKSAPSSCEGQFGSTNNRDEGYPTSSDSTPSHSGGATFSIAKDHLHYKWCVEGVDRVKAEEMVESEPDGTLLYRINGDKHVITIKRTDKIYHHLVTRQGNKFIFKGLDNVTGTSVYNIVFNYLEHCKGKVVPYGGSIDAKKEGHEDYDRPWNPPDVKILVSQVAKELEKKARTHGSPTGIGGRRLSEGHKGAPNKQQRPGSIPEEHKQQRSGSLPVRTLSSSGRPSSAPIVEDEQTDYVNEGEDVAEDEIYENTEPEEVYLNTASRDDIYQNTPDITKINIDSHEAYMNLSPKQPPLPRSKLPKATPRLPGGKQYINAAAERVEDVAYSDSDHYLKLKPDDPEEVYEPMEH